MMSARKRLKSRRRKYVTEGQSSWSGSLGRLRKKAMLSLAFLAIIQYPDIRVRPASRRIKKAPLSKAEAQFIQARYLKLMYIFTSHRSVLLVPSRLTWLQASRGRWPLSLGLLGHEESEHKLRMNWRSVGQRYAEHSQTSISSFLSHSSSHLANTSYRLL